ncbi:MAG: hypothetical protein ACXVHX_24375 [Solirubrobacteraceae bacterium]
MASALHISPTTATTHPRSLNLKLDLSSRSDAVARAGERDSLRGARGCRAERARNAITPKG